MAIKDEIKKYEQMFQDAANAESYLQQAKAQKEALVKDITELEKLKQEKQNESAYLITQTEAEIAILKVNFKTIMAQEIKRLEEKEVVLNAKIKDTDEKIETAKQKEREAEALSQSLKEKIIETEKNNAKTKILIKENSQLSEELTLQKQHQEQIQKNIEKAGVDILQEIGRASCRERV